MDIRIKRKKTLAMLLVVSVALLCLRETRNCKYRYGWRNELKAQIESLAAENEN